MNQSNPQSFGGNFHGTSPLSEIAPDGSIVAAGSLPAGGHHRGATHGECSPSVKEMMMAGIGFLQGISEFVEST